VLRYINYFQYATYLHFRVPRVKCSNCGTLKIRVPGAREQSHFTLQMEAIILKLSKRMPVLQVGNLLGEHDTRIWRVIIEVAKTIKSHWDGILNYFESRITNGILEGINNIAQLIKRNA
jgi:transposase